MSNKELELAPPTPPPSQRKSQNPAFDLSHPNLSLVLFNLLISIPFSYLVSITNKKVFQFLGYEKIMRCPSGTRGTKALFVVVNLVLIFFCWGQMCEEGRWERVERLREEVEWWDGECGRSDGLLVESRLRSSQKADQQLRREALLALGKEERVPNYERDSVVNADGVREWDSVVGAKSLKAKNLGQGGSGLKGLMQSQSQSQSHSKLPKLKLNLKLKVANKGAGGKEE